MGTAIVAVVNGYPEVGKDTVVEMLRRHLLVLGWNTMAISSVDRVKGMTRDMGIPEEPKTPEKRALWAAIKEAFENYDRAISRDCIKQAIAHASSGYPKTMFFIHAREPEAIEFMAKEIEQYPTVKFVKIFVDRPTEGRVFSNTADQYVENVAYDVVIHNKATLEVLDDLCRAFADHINSGGIE